MSSEPQRNDDRRPYMSRRQDLSKPVKEGDEYDVTIETLGSKGDGIAKIKGLIIFIKNVKPKDQVKIRITSVRSNFATAEVIGTTGGSAEAEESEETTEEDESDEDTDKDEDAKQNP